ncbi:hypothetical protein [Pseudomonas trivialis]|jgi:hypothetical protein|uniref:hypothetical protein n=1 Tax=Pseudomonas trivialis TaxID=200450 RepID=UPI0030D41D0D
MAKNMFGRDGPLGKKPYALRLLKVCVFAGSVFLAAALRQCRASSRESDLSKKSVSYRRFHPARPCD